jgi:hypothetical protein
MTDATAGSSSQWQPIPGSHAVLSGVASSISTRGGDPLPSSIRAEVFRVILPTDEAVVASMYSPRVIVATSGQHPSIGPPGLVITAEGIGQSPQTFLALTRSRILIFSAFWDMEPGTVSVTVAGPKSIRRYLSVPFTGASVSPYTSARFTLAWNTGLSVTICAKVPASPPIYRRKPIRLFYQAICQVLGQPSLP